MTLACGRRRCRELAAETALNAPVNAMDFSPQGATVAAALDDGSLVIVGTDGAMRASMAAHDRPARAVAYSPDGSILASGGDDGRVRLWDAERGVLLAEAPTVPDSVTALTFTSDGYLLAGDARGVVRRLDASSGAERWPLWDLPPSRRLQRTVPTSRQLERSARSCCWMPRLS